VLPLPSVNQAPESPLFEFEPELNADSELEPLPESLPESLPAPLPESLPAPTAKTRVFKVAKAPVSVPASVPASSRSKTLMKIATKLGNLKQSGINLQNTLGSMDGDRQTYNVDFPIEEEELAKLDEQFKTLQIRPSGLSAVPGSNFEENQQKLISLMREAELEGQEEQDEELESKNERNSS
jgi:hypothetical protein